MVAVQQLGSGTPGPAGGPATSSAAAIAKFALCTTGTLILYSSGGDLSGVEDRGRHGRVRAQVGQLTSLMKLPKQSFFAVCERSV